MGIYFFVLCFFGIASLLEILGLKEKQSNLLFLILISFLFLVSFLRWETGTDWASYYYFFNSDPDWGEFDVFEPLYATFTTIAKRIFDSYTVLLLLLSSVLYYFQYNGIKFFSVYPLTSLFVLAGYGAGNVFYIRQTVAVAILFYSIRYVQEKRIIPFVLMVVAAAMFHRSSWVFLLAWWVYYLKMSRRMMIVTVLISVAFSAVVAYVLQLLGSVFGGVIESKLAIYLSEESTSGISEHSYATLVIKGVANKLLVFGVGIYVLGKIKDEFQKIRGYVNLYWFATILYFSTMSISIVLVRFSFGFDAFQIVVLPLIFNYCKNIGTRIIVFLLLSIYLCARMYMYFTSYYDEYVPFTSIFDIML